MTQAPSSENLAELYAPPRLTAYGQLQMETAGTSGDAFDGSFFTYLSNCSPWP
jgi:hypothetical protein